MIMVVMVTGGNFFPSDELLAQVDDSELSKFTCFIA